MDMEQIICQCNAVSIQQISDTIADGAKSLEEVQEVTGAGTICGACIDDLTNVVDELLKK